MIVRHGKTFHFSVPTHNTSGVRQNADEVPKFWVFEENTDSPALIAASGMTLRTGWIGLYRGQFEASNALGFDDQKFYEVVVSGRVNNIVGWDVAARLQFSESVFYADIKFNRDNTNSRDEYTVSFFKDGGQVVPSSSPTPGIQIIKRSDGTNMVAPSGMTEVANGVWKYDVNNASQRQSAGEAYIVQVSGYVDNNWRQWRKIVGRDS